MLGFNHKEIELLLESLRYTKMAFEEYQDYPDKRFQDNRIKEVEELIEKIRAEKKSIS